MESGIVDAVGVWFYALDTNRYLYLMRRDTKNPCVWGLPGGKKELNETLLECMTRECQEELGIFPECKKIVPVEQFTNGNNFVYHTFICIIDREFQPTLNDEHYGYAWLDSGIMPKPMHPGLWNTIQLEEIKKKIDFLESIHRNN